MLFNTTNLVFYANFLINYGILFLNDTFAPHK